MISYANSEMIMGGNAAKEVGANHVCFIRHTIDEKIHENNRIRVYRGRRVQDSQPVVIKALREAAPNPSGISRLIYEYEITRTIKRGDCQTFAAGTGRDGFRSGYEGYGGCIFAGLSAE